MTGVTPVLYAFTLGLVAAVNPCGFPLLPAYLALFAGGDSRPDWVGRTVRGMTAGACVTAGFVAVFGALGFLVESGMQLIIGWVPWLMIMVGGVMVLLGLHAVVGGHLRIPLPGVRFGSGRTVFAMTGFGVAYAVASLSCALPVFLAGVAGTFTRHSLFDGMGVFLAYALGMGVFVTAASLIAAHIGASLLRRIGPVTRFIPRVAGGVVSLVGVYLTYYWVSELLNPLDTPVMTRFVDAVQSGISAWLAASALVVGGLLGATVLVGFIILAVSARNRNKKGNETDHA